MTELDLIGGGGHASVVADVARRAGFPAPTLWCDEPPDLSRFPAGTQVAELPSLEAGRPVVLAIGDLEARRRLREHFSCIGPSVVDPTAVVGGGVSLGRGTVVMANCVINANATVGEDAILNTGCIVEHDCVIGANAHISPGVRLAGAVRVGRGAHLGLGALVLPGRSIGDGAVVGAGAVVNRDVPDGVTVAGIPARILAR